jgi:hypothetical protein
MATLAGIDVGLTLVTPTSGVCRTGQAGFVLDHVYSDRYSREAALGTSTFDVLAVDGPVLPGSQLNYAPRICEKIFVWNPFQTRCKPGESQVPGSGRALRRGGCDTAWQWHREVSGAALSAPFPRVWPDKNIVEAFPNGFLGVLLPIGAVGRLRRGDKFDALYDACGAQGMWATLSAILKWTDPKLFESLPVTTDHDERAALVCALTALCVWKGRYVAVGEPQGGYLFFPPWSLWPPWAKAGLDQNRKDRRLTGEADVWIDGRQFRVGSPLP